jgi:simple sugar transport system permease protein
MTLEQKPIGRSPMEVLDGTLARLTVTPAGGAGVVQTAVRTLVALVFTVGIFAALLALLGANPGDGLQAIWNGALGNKFNFGQTVMITSLLALTGLAAAIPFTAHLWNVGGEGQLWFGAFVATAIGLTLPSDFPHWLLATLAVVLATLGGAVWGFVPGLLKATINANEVITSLMMTFIAIQLGNYAISTLWPSFSNQTQDVPSNALLPNIWTGTLVTAGALLAVAAVAVAWLVMARTGLGFEIRAIGLNSNAARMNGMSLGRVTIVAFVLGGAFGGLAGAIAVLGINGSLISNFSANFGYLGIAVALVARLDPLWMIPSAFLFAALRVGSNGLQAETGLSTTIGEILVTTFVVLLLVFKVIRVRYAEAAQ